MSISPDEVRTIRQRLELTQAELAKKMNLSREAITQWENGRASPTGPAEILLRYLVAEADARKKMPV